MRFRVEAGHVTAFARAIGDQVAVEQGVVPPTFSAASVQYDPAHMRDMRPAGPLGLEPPPGEVMLHAEQHFDLRRPVVVGEVLVVAESFGEPWYKQARDGARLTFTEVVKELRDQQGELVVSSRMTLVSRVVP